MDWNDVRYFLALARSGSVRAAGNSLGVSHSTVARRIEALERRLAARLFDRSREGYALTGAGRQMLPGAERIEAEMATLERGLVGQDERLAGLVSFTCCDSFVSELMIRELTPFCDQHPEIELCITADSRPFDLAKREADIAIRILGRSDQPPEYLIGRRMAPLVLCSYVATAHAERLDPTEAGTPARWLSIEDRKLHHSMIASSSYPEIPPWGSFSSLDLLVQAARAGLGLVMLPTYVGDPDRALHRLPHPDLRHVADLWLLTHPDLRDNARIRATRAAVAQGMKDHQALFEGRFVSAPGCPEIAPDGAARPVVR